MSDNQKWSILQGDALKVLGTFAPNTFDAVITDPPYEQNFSMVLRVLEYAEVKEDDDEYVSPLDLLFRAMEYENPESVALRQYKVFKQAAGDICSK